MSSASRPSPGEIESLRISVVIPCYNAAAYLEQAVRSVQNQTREVMEIIVVDDGSRDDSRAIAKRLGARVVELPGNSGPAAARNRGIEASNGDVIAFLDADDYWAPTHCADVVSLLEHHPECAVAFSRIHRFGTGEESVSPVFLAADTPTPSLWHLLRDNIVPQSAVAVRRSVFLEHGGYDEARRHSEDYELWLRLARHAPFVSTNAVSVHYRMHEQQVSRNLELMLSTRWDVKLRFWRDAARREPPGFVQRLEDVLLNVWNDTLRSAWLTRDQELFRTALALHDMVPHSAATWRRWKRRYRTAWYAWVTLSRAWERMPRGAKRLARPAIASLFAPHQRRVS